jgi:putative N6-adenine-specific DNA methylase
VTAPDREFELFAVLAPGLEEVARRELAAAGLPRGRPEPGGLTFRGTLATALEANLRLRTPTRLLLRLSTFMAPGRRELSGAARRLALDAFVPPGAPVRLSVSCSKSRLYHTGLVSEVLHEALGRPPAPTTRDAPEFFVRIVRDRCTISIDTSGEPLHKRGWRVEGGRAPLRETLAAGSLLLCGWDGSTALHDPMCGSGTFAIEAALVASGIAPGLGRRFACESFPAFDSAVSKSLREAAGALRRAPAVPIVATDVHAGSLAAGARNAARAGVAEAIRFERVDVARLTPAAATGLVIVNPPYGKRIEHARGPDGDWQPALAAAYLGPFREWTRAVFAPPGAARGLFDGPPDRTHLLSNGGIPIELAVRLPAGAPR